MKEDLSIDKKSKNIKHNPKKAEDLDEIYFENQRLNESTHINIKRRNSRKNNSRKYEKGQFNIHDTVKYGERLNKECKRVLRSYTRSKKTSHHPVLKKEYPQRESIELTQKHPKEWIEAVSSNLVNMVKYSKLSEWSQNPDARNHYEHQRDTQRVPRSHQSY